MKLLNVFLFGAASAHAAFVPSLSSGRTSSVIARGYLDDLSAELQGPDANPNPEEESAEANKMAKEDLDRFGPGNFQDFVDFDEFDGGDGQMGVAGDGKKGLEKFGEDVTPAFAKSKTMSAKNAWGTSTGYADELRSKGVETSRAQQLENWRNQQEIRLKAQQMREMTENFDQVTENAEADWRTLAKFGVERNEEFDLDEEFGPVVAGDEIEGVIQLTGNIGQNVVYEFPLRNPYMGFADFRAAFTPSTPMCWTVSPNEGSIMQREDTMFIVKFKAENPGVAEGHLVIQTEDFKKTWQVIGSTS